MRAQIFTDAAARGHVEQDAELDMQSDHFPTEFIASDACPSLMLGCGLSRRWNHPV
jgi:hypothetical protein